MDDFAYGNDAEYWHGEYQKLRDALSVIKDSISDERRTESAEEDCGYHPNISQPHKSCVTCGWYCGKNQCAKKNHGACSDWIATD